jgi:hypothetical protein
MVKMYRKIWWGPHVARVEVNRNSCPVFVGSAGVGHLADSHVNSAVWQWFLRLCDKCVGLDSLGYRQKTLAGCSMHGDATYFECWCHAACIFQNTHAHFSTGLYESVTFSLPLISNILPLVYVFRACLVFPLPFAPYMPQSTFSGAPLTIHLPAPRKAVAESPSVLTV